MWPGSNPSSNIQDPGSGGCAQFSTGPLGGYGETEAQSKAATASTPGPQPGCQSRAVCGNPEATGTLEDVGAPKAMATPNVMAPTPTEHPPPPPSPQGGFYTARAPQRRSAPPAAAPRWERGGGGTLRPPHTRLCFPPRLFPLVATPSPSPEEKRVEKSRE